MLAEAPSWYVPPTQRFELIPEQQETLAVNVTMDQIAGRHFPQNLRQGIKSVATENNISPWDVVRMIRENDNPDQAAEIRKKYQEKVIYFGCIHGGSPDFVTQLNSIANASEVDLPEIIVFGGDLPGAVKQRTIKQKFYFYNNLMNNANSLLKAQPDISQNDLLDAPISDSQAESRTVRDGALKLLQFALEEMAEYDLSNQDKEAAMKRLMLQQMGEYKDKKMGTELSKKDMDTLLARYIKWIHTVEYAGLTGLNSGTWVGTLPKEIRQRYMDQYRLAALEMAVPLLKLKARGVVIEWVEGNEDNELSLKVAMGDIENVFDTQKFLESEGISCRRKIGGRKGRGTYHIFLPYFELLDYEMIPNETILQLQQEVEQARAEGLEVIVVAHEQLDWDRHFPGKPPQSYHVKAMANLRKALDDFKPDELVYPQMHSEMVDLPDRNAKYVDGQTVVSYLPLLAMGELALPVHDRKGRKIKVFGGERQPVRRIT